MCLQGCIWFVSIVNGNISKFSFIVIAKIINLCILSLHMFLMLSAFYLNMCQAISDIQVKFIGEELI